MSVVRALRRYGGTPQRSDRTPRCELCASPIAEEHPHVADVQARTLACACRACALLFAQPGAGGGHQRTVPDRVRSDPAFTLREEDWTALQVPVRLAFFLFSSAAKRWVALYPGPGGITESEVPEEAWAALASARLVAEAVPDVEAIVAWTSRGASTAECFLVPITACYELTARLRSCWKGFDGGDEARAALASFFARLRERSRPLRAREGVAP